MMNLDCFSLGFKFWELLTQEVLTFTFYFPVCTMLSAWDMRTFIIKPNEEIVIAVPGLQCLSPHCKALVHSAFFRSPQETVMWVSKTSWR